MVREKFCNPLFLSVFICVLIIYLNAGHIPEKNGFTSIIPKEKVTKLSGYIPSSPARTSKGSFYSCQMKVFSSYDGVMLSLKDGFLMMFFSEKKYCHVSLNQIEKIKLKSFGQRED